MEDTFKRVGRKKIKSEPSPDILQETCASYNNQMGQYISNPLKREAESASNSHPPEKHRKVETHIIGTIKQERSIGEYGDSPSQERDLGQDSDSQTGSQEPSLGQDRDSQSQERSLGQDRDNQSRERSLGQDRDSQTGSQEPSLGQDRDSQSQERSLGQDRDNQSQERSLGQDRDSQTGSQERSLGQDRDSESKKRYLGQDRDSQERSLGQDRDSQERSLVEYEESFDEDEDTCSCGEETETETSQLWSETSQTTVEDEPGNQATDAPHSTQNISSVDIHIEAQISASQEPTTSTTMNKQQHQVDSEVMRRDTCSSEISSGEQVDSNVAKPQTSLSFQKGESGSDIKSHCDAGDSSEVPAHDAPLTETQSPGSPSVPTEKKPPTATPDVSRRSSRRAGLSKNSLLNAQYLKAASCTCEDCALSRQIHSNRKSNVRRMCEILASPKMKSSLKKAIARSLRQKDKQLTFTKRFVLKAKSANYANKAVTQSVGTSSKTHGLPVTDQGLSSQAIENNNNKNPGEPMKNKSSTSTPKKNYKPCKVVLHPLGKLPKEPHHKVPSPQKTPCVKSELDYERSRRAYETEEKGTMCGLTPETVTVSTQTDSLSGPSTSCSAQTPPCQFCGCGYGTNTPFTGPLPGLGSIEYNEPSQNIATRLVKTDSYTDSARNVAISRCLSERAVVAGSSVQDVSGSDSNTNTVRNVAISRCLSERAVVAGSSLQDVSDSGRKDPPSDTESIDCVPPSADESDSVHLTQLQTNLPLTRTSSRKRKPSHKLITCDVDIIQTSMHRKTHTSKHKNTHTSKHTKTHPPKHKKTHAVKHEKPSIQGAQNNQNDSEKAKLRTERSDSRLHQDKKPMENHHEVPMNSCEFEATPLKGLKPKCDSGDSHTHSRCDSGSIHQGEIADECDSGSIHQGERADESDSFIIHQRGTPDESDSDITHQGETADRSTSADGSTTAGGAPHQENPSLPQGPQPWKFLPMVVKNDHRETIKKWVEQHFEMDPRSCLPRQQVYELYQKQVRDTCLCFAPNAIIGRVMQDCFPRMCMRRLGGRSQSKYYYMGINLKTTDGDFTELANERVFTQGKPKISRAFNGAKKRK